jgi:ABC-type dipeptide/oligopeptide/nickel transport system permease subunit
MTTTEHNTADDFATPRRDRLRRAFFRFSQSKLSMLGAAIVAVVIFFTIFGTVLAPYPNHVAGGVDTASRFMSPSAAHPFGTNELGQDVLSLVMAGTTVSVLAGFGVVLIGSVIGTLVGAVAGFARGWVDEVLMRLTDLTLTIPGLILAMAIAAALGSGFGNMVIAIALSWWPGYARLVRGEVLAAREEVYVTAARARRHAQAHPLPSYPAQRRLADHRQDVARHGLCHSHRGGPRLHRHRRPPADAGMGHAAFGLAFLHARLLVDGDGAWHGDVPCGVRLQPSG